MSNPSEISNKQAREVRSQLAIKKAARKIERYLDYDAVAMSTLADGKTPEQFIAAIITEELEGVPQSECDGCRARNVLLLEMSGRGELLAKEHVNPDSLNGLEAARLEFERLRDMIARLEARPTFRAGVAACVKKVKAIPDIYPEAPSGHDPRPAPAFKIDALAALESITESATPQLEGEAWRKEVAWPISTDADITESDCVNCGSAIEKLVTGPPINDITWWHLHNGVVWCNWPAPASL